eukprot:gene6051-1781_t
MKPKVTQGSGGGMTQGSDGGMTQGSDGGMTQGAEADDAAGETPRTNTAAVTSS